MVRASDAKSVFDYLMKSEYASLLEKTSSENPSAIRMAKAAHTILSLRCCQLAKLASGRSGRFLEAYLQRFVVEDLKRMLRTKHSGESIDSSLLIPVPKIYDWVGLQGISQASTVQEAISRLAETRFAATADALPLFEKYHLVSIIEAFLDRIYFHSIVRPSLKRLSSQKWVRQMVGVEMDLVSIKTLMDLRSRKVPPEAIRGINFMPLGLTEKQTAAISSASPESIPQLLSKTDYTDLSQPLLDSLDAGKDESLDHVTRLEVFRRTESLMFPCAYTLAYVLGYVREAEAEAGNLVAVVSGKELGLSESRIQAALCV